MKKHQKSKTTFRKMVNEIYLISKKRGGGMVKMEAVDDFISYEDLVERFEQEIQAFLK